MAVNVKKDFGDSNRKRKPDLNTLVYGKIPPQNPEFEDDILGCILMDKEHLSNVVAILDSPDNFYVDANQRIYKAMLMLRKGGYPIDMSTVLEQLRKNDDLELSGGLHQLMKISKSVNYFDYEAPVFKAIGVRESFAKREAIRLYGHAINDLYNDSGDFHEIIGLVSKELNGIADHGGGDTVHISKAYREMVEGVADRMANKGKLSGVNTGTEILNKLTNGWQKSDLIILAARPSVGKTALALTFGEAGASNSGAGLFFSLEMSKKQLAERIASTATEIPLYDIKRGTLSEEQFALLSMDAKGIAGLPFHLNDRAGINLEQLSSIARQYKKKHDIQWIIIDYMQLISPMDKKAIREQQVAEISRGLKKLAKELDIPIIALAQISRDFEKRAGGKPQLSDLRESGSIEQDADLVMFIYVEDDGSGALKHRVKIAKHRNGTVDDIELQFIAAIQKWQDIDLPFHSLAPQNAHAGFGAAIAAGYQNTGNNYNKDFFNNNDDDIPM